MQEVGPGLHRRTPWGRGFAGRKRERKIGRGLRLISNGKAFGGAFGQVMGFVHDEDRIAIVPARHGFEG